MKQIYKFIRILCKDLKIDRPKVIIRDDLLTPTTLADYIFGRNTIELSKNYESEYDLYFAIAHELRYKHQIFYNKFDYDNYKTREDLSISEYNLQFEEIDANAYAYLIMVNAFGVEPQFNGLEENIKNKILKRVEEIYKEERN